MFGKMYSLAAALITLILCFPAIGVAQHIPFSNDESQTVFTSSPAGDLASLRAGISAPTTIGLFDAETLECQSEQLNNDCNRQQDDSDEEVEPWRLFGNSCWLQRNGMVAGGAISQGFTWNPDSPADRSNGTLAYNDRSNEYQLNQIHFYLEKPLDEDSDCFHIGGMVEAFYGTDALFNQTIGLDDDWDSGRYGLILPQSYLSLSVPVGNGITVKLGHFWGLLGYEGTAALDRHFYSSSNTNNILEPNTDTGIQLSYGLNDHWSIVAALTRGLDVWDDVNNRVAFTANLSWECEASRTSISYAFYYDGGINNNAEQYLGSFVVEQELCDILTYVFWHDHGFADPSGIGGSDASWYSIAQYLLYHINDCWTANARLEWVRDQDGFLLSSGTGDLWGMTLGLNYKPTANLAIRPEVRWDWSNGLTPLFDDQTDQNQFTAAMDIVVTF